MRLAVPIKVVGQRFGLPILVLASVAMIVLGKADTLLFERMRSGFADSAAPVLRIISEPVAAIDSVVGDFRDLFALRSENARLRVDNERLLRWQQVAQGLEVENGRLRELLKLTPDPSASFVTGRVIANSGGAFVRSVLIDAGNGAGVVRGQAAITGEGLVGRVTEVGERAARILLVTDLNSRIPVAVDGSRERAVLAGDNSDEPRLVYLPPRSALKVGDRLVTSGNGGIFPPGLPVGVVSGITDGIIRVQPYAELSRLDFLRIVDYGLNGVLPQAVAPRPPKPARGGRAG
ncbi:MAG: rod shape-determining protein MreC [Rhodospirillales bacterium]|jgi:rod shape-determining protein MreC|nr:rod shape-determining protein MreC [Rhodospirillales bacterium]